MVPGTFGLGWGDCAITFLVFKGVYMVFGGGWLRVIIGVSRAEKNTVSLFIIFFLTSPESLRLLVGVFSVLPPLIVTPILTLVTISGGFSFHRSP